ncbi:MAG: DNA-processing protein DprA [Oscillospiraceae bacterium]|nr:DNA-processing protein DprA [Oscillospiraceae bacterium]
MAKSPVEVWLWLLMVMQPFNSKTNYILSQCGNDATRACRDIRDGRFPFLSDGEKRRAAEVRNGAVYEIMRTCAEHNVRIITLDDDEYPVLLKCTEKPPVVLFVAGSLAGLNDRLSIATVGAREVTDYSVKTANYLCEPLARAGAAIVSGLAVGSDTAAHRACLNAGGRTIGVAGCGILVNYPKESAGLKREIVDSGGAIISELMPTARSFGAYFHERNRIISGLANGTLVIQAAESSGSLLTAAHAIRQERALFAVPPHDISSPVYRGNANLIREGALSAADPRDITDWFRKHSIDDEELLRKVAELTSRIAAKKPPARLGSPVSRKPKKPEKSPEERDSVVDETVFESLSENETALLKLISAAPADSDTLMDKSDMDFGELSEALTNLEIDGCITRTPEGLYARA